MKYIKYILFCILSLALMNPAIGAVKASGSVRDAVTGAPLYGAHIAIDGTNWMAISDIDGGFEFSDLPAGEYQITVSYIGCKPETLPLIIHSDSESSLDILLQPVNIFLPEVTVEVHKPEAKIYTSDQIRKSSADNLAAFLNSTGEIMIIDAGGSQQAEIVIRGAKSEQIAVYLDGYRMNDPRTGKVDLKDIPLNSIDKIVINSNSDLSMGSSSPGGSVELYSAGFSGKSAGFEAGSFGKRGFSIDAGEDYGNHKISFSFKRTVSDGDFKYTDPDTHVEEVRMNDDYSSDNFFMKYQNEISASSDMSVSFHRMSSARGAPGSIQNPDTLDRINTKRSGISADLNIHQEGWINQNRIHYYETSFENIDYLNWTGHYLDFTSGHRTVAFEADSRLTRKDSLGFSIVGASYRMDQVESSTLANEEDRRDFGIFFQRSIKMAGLSISNTIRSDFYWQYSSLISSSMNIRYNPALLNNNLTFSANWNRDFNLPTFNQLFWAENVFAAANPDLLPERLSTYDIGAEWMQEGLSLRSTYFHRTIKDMIVWRESFTQSGKKWKPFNSDSALIQGFELISRLNLKRFSLNAAATISDPRNQSEGYKGNYLIFRPVLQTSESVSYRFKNFETTVQHRYLSRRYILEANTKWEEPVSLFDLSFGYTRLLKTWKYTFNLRIDNILDENYEIINDSPMPGRNFTSGLTIHFN